jgi:hypothetical protein
MEQGLKAIALAAIMLAYSATADAVAWKAKGYYHFWMDIEEIGFKGEAGWAVTRSSTGVARATTATGIATTGPAKVMLDFTTSTMTMNTLAPFKKCRSRPCLPFWASGSFG